MKNIDIELLERKNLEEIPEGFFEEMQNFVISNTMSETEKEETTSKQIHTFSWFKITSAAAVVALLFGLLYLILNRTETSFKQDSAMPKITRTEKLTPLQNEKLEVEKNNPQAIIVTPREHESHFVVQTNKTDKKRVATKPSYQLEQILATMTDKELADLGSKNEQDVYLDLYD